MVQIAVGQLCGLMLVFEMDGGDPIGITQYFSHVERKQRALE
jgi:hypothetical protein